jgi:hydroxymethylpyrimidine/phosphomethylpyrimidine kinase
VLSIAGSDSGGGAGIQADLKAFARSGVHGMTAITAITAQNTVAVTAVHPVPGEVIVEQVRAVVDDIGVDAVKIGMLGSVATIEAVGEALDLVADAPVVLDPVMISESGARLLDEDAQEALRTQLVPRATVVTPNVPEAQVLSGSENLDPEDLVRAVRARSSSPVAIARRPPISSSTASGSSRYPDRAMKAGPRMGRAAPTPPRSPPTWRSASTRSMPPGRPS